MKQIHILTDKQLRQLIDSQVSSALIASNISYESEILMKQANISALQAQITPHFLYNALECIRGQALIEGSPRIASAAFALSQFFRYSISCTSDTMPLSDEFDNIRNYAYVQRFRFQEKFVMEFQYDTDDKEILNAMLPKLTLQPIVENAILHGLKTMETGGKIILSAFHTNSYLRILVSDNGTGIPPEELRELNNWIHTYYTKPTVAPAEKKSKFGIALANVDRRLKLLFGPDYGLTVYSNPGLGTDVELFLPFRPVTKK